MYRAVRPLLFALEPERAHRLTVSLLGGLARSPGALRAVSARFRIEDERLRLRRFGLHFPNPLGLAAGLDKDAVAVPAWQALGFGFVEVGSVTRHPQPGNPAPRLFRLPAEGALVNRMGFNNLGAVAVASRLEQLPRLPAPVLVNVGKSRAVPLDEAAADYLGALELLLPYADGAVINVSSPNTPGLRALQAGAALGALLAALEPLRRQLRRPLLLKVAPDLSEGELADIVAVAEEHRVDGLVAVNTTLERPGLASDPGEPGGLSGRPLAARSLQVLRFLADRTELPLVSVGGVEDAADLVARLRAGASLVEVYTALVYRGPELIRHCLEGLLRHLERERLASVEELIGRDR